MNSRILIPFFLLNLAAGATHAAPSASFTARKIQGTTCLAPCAVHFDAIGQGALSGTPYVTPETTDPDFSRPFHSLYFSWDFGDPASGEWANGAAAGTTTRASRNHDVGALAGHLYEAPGTYTVTLTVTNPNGQSSTATRSVVVGDRTTYFSAANTLCFANDDSNWSGCPLSCASDDNCTVTNDLDLALEGGDNCSGSDDCANADGQQRRVLFRRGDRFTSNATIDPYAGTTPGFVEAFGSGAKPTFDLGGGIMESGDGWTFMDVALTNCNTSCITGTVNDDRATYVRVSASFDASCWENNNLLPWPPAAFDNWPYLWALIDIDCTGTSGQSSYGSWPGSNYFLWMGGTFNHAPSGGGNASSVRTHHMQHSLISHVDYRNPTPGREHLQLRNFDVVGDLTCGNANECAGMFNLISDNSLEESAANTFHTVRICVDAGCNCGLSPTGCGDNTEGTIVPVHDYIFERNFHYWPQDTATGKAAVYEIQGGGVTIRNNVFDLQGAFTGSFGLVTALGQPLSRASGSTPTGDVHVYNNTAYFSDSNASAWSFSTVNTANGTGCTSNCFSRNNLLVAPNFTGSTSTSSSFSASNNLLLRTPNPFATTVPSRGSTRISSFRLGSGSAGAVDTGYSFSASSNRSAWVYDDAFGGCRGTSSTGAWDVGASEFGASLCNTSSSSQTLLLPPTLLSPR